MKQIRVFSILYSLLLLLSGGLEAQNDRFYSSLDGLSGTTLYGFFQDSKGYLWIPTYSGLNRFDGYNFKVYQQILADSTTLNSTDTNVVFEDSSGNLWIGTNYGLNQYSYKHDNFKRIHFFVKNKEFPLTVRSILEDKNQFIWLITTNGLIKFNPKDGKYDFYNHQFNSDGIPSYSKYNQAIIDSKGNLMIGTEDFGVLVFDVKRSKFQSLQEYTGISYQFPDRTVLVVHQNKSGQIIFGTQRAGLVMYEPSLGKFKQVPYSNNPSNLLNGGIYSIITDRRGVIWVGTERNGLKIYNPDRNELTDANHFIDKLPDKNKAKFYCYEDRSGDLWFGIQFRGIYHKISSAKLFHSIGNSKIPSLKLSHFIVKSILLDSKGNLWVGTDGGGLNVLYKGAKEFVIFTNSGSAITLMDKAIIKLYEDRRGWIWIGTYLEGLYCYQGSGKVLKNYNMPGSDKERWNNYIFDITEDTKGNLWIGTNGGGLFYMDVEHEIIASASSPTVAGKTQTIGRFINVVKFNTDSTLWVGTYNGLFAWNKKKDKFRAFTMGARDLASDVIFTLAKDKFDNIWIGTLSGLYSFNPETNVWENYTTVNGICGNTIMAIEADDKNNLWISTTVGISKFNLQTKIFQNYYEYDGLPCNEYRPDASLKDKKGNIYFGGVDGLVYFHPDSIQDDPEKPNLIFTSFKIFNQEVKNEPFNPKSILHNHINQTDTIILNYSQKSFTLEFAAINFTVPEKIKYAVQLKGFSEDWDYKDFKQRYATYTNLDPGTYLLNIKSTNLDGVWIDQPRQLCLIIKPPFWITWWAFLIYLAVFLLAIYYGRKISLSRISMKNQLHLEQMEGDKQKEMSQAKMQFFTNISHDIRTPLTMIVAPLERLVNSTLDETQKKLVNYIYRNTKRLERIVNQLLELHKIENVQLKLQTHKIDLVRFLEEITHLFEETANDQKIHLSFEPTCEELMVWIDPDKMDKVMFNLISNAIKFTPADGLITISLITDREQSTNNSDSGSFIISVSDTGSGMSQAHQDRIFERFYQIENKEMGINIGTGIGLHLAKELVEIQHGTITIKSSEEAGSTFLIHLPLGNKHLSAEEMIPEKQFPEIYSHQKTTSIIQSDKLEFNQEVNEFTDETQMLVLLIEDDSDILNYLEDELSSDYQIIKANNGTDGWKMAFERIPNLIISDIMMPGIDGLQLCKKIKTTIETSHIPVILLSAKTSVEQEIEGLEIGADDYVHKPFNSSLLKVKVGKIIESREKLKQYFSSSTSFVAKEMTVTSADEKFLQKAIDFVKDNLSDNELNIEKMGKFLNISRVHLYRKLKAITNQNPTEFIRTIRLKQAAYLLSMGKLNVSEIAYMVGFNSHQYFTNSFQKYFNMSPTEYSKKTENERKID